MLIKFIYFFTTVFIIFSTYGATLEYQWDAGSRYIYQLSINSRMKYSDQNQTSHTSSLVADGYVFWDVESFDSDRFKWKMKFGFQDFQFKSINNSGTESTSFFPNGYFQAEKVDSRGFSRNDVEVLGDGWKAFYGRKDIPDTDIKPFFSGIELFELPPRELSKGEKWISKKNAFESFPPPITIEYEWQLENPEELNRGVLCKRYQVTLVSILSDEVGGESSTDKEKIDFILKFKQLKFSGDLWLNAENNVIVEWRAISQSSGQADMKISNSPLRETPEQNNEVETLISLVFLKEVTPDYKMSEMPTLSVDSITPKSMGTNEQHENDEPSMIVRLTDGNLSWIINFIKIVVVICIVIVVVLKIISRRKK